MKKYLNKLLATILLITVGLIFFIYSNSDSDKLNNELNNFNSRSAPSATQISNPIFKNKGLNANPYEIKATKGIQIDQDIELYEVFGEFTNDNNELLYIKADKGLYSQFNQIIGLMGNVLIFDEFGNRTSTNRATIDINNKKINLLDNVVSVSNTSTIKSNSSLVDEKNGTITYTGNVTVKIEN